MLDTNQIDTRYAKSGELNIAYQVFGAGQLDIVDSTQCAAALGDQRW